MDRIWEAYWGTWGGRRIQLETRERIDWIVGKIEGRHILDIGCSQGLLAFLLAKADETARVTGIDISEDCISFANEQLAKTPTLCQRISFYTGDFLSITPKNTYDTIVIGQVLEHTSDPRAFLAHASEFISPAGRIIVTVPYGLWEHDEHQHTFFAAMLYDMMPETLRIGCMELAGSRLGAVATVDGSVLTRADVLALEYDFIIAKERRYQANEKIQKKRVSRLEAKVATLEKRLIEKK